MSFPVYLYTGPEFGLRGEAVEKVKASLKKKYGDIDEHLYYLVETPFAEVINILSAGTLFTSATCVVCKNAELIKKNDIALLSDWLASVSDEGNGSGSSASDDSDSSVLILVSDEISVDAKLDKLIPESNKRKFWEMFEKDKLPWVQNYFQKNGFRIERDAAQLILDMIENNTEALKNECSRFFVCFQKDHIITCDDVDSILINNREESAFTLFNRISNADAPVQKRFEDGLTILQKIKLSKDTNSVLLIAGLASCFRKLALWHSICPNGYSTDSGTLKNHGFSSSTMQRQYTNAAKIWSSGQAAAILAILSAADMEIRSGGSMMEEVILQKMLYEIVVKKGASIQVLNCSEDF
ncbi:MAG: DNA polymerase III subunit delta [Treponema sp.]|nr:DNA polymerase III subunit delta [Treponema sp.]